MEVPQAPEALSGLTLCHFLFKAPDQLGGEAETGLTSAAFDRLDARGCRVMGLYGTSTTAQQDIQGIIHERAAIARAEPQPR